MTRTRAPQNAQTRPSAIIVIALYLFFVATVVRTLIRVANVPAIQDRLGWFLGLELVFLALVSLVLWRPAMPPLLLHAVFACQSILILAVFALAPDLDFVTALFMLPTYQAVMLFTGRKRWTWVLVFVALTGASSILFLEPLRGLALGLIPMAGEFVLAVYTTASQEVSAAHARSQAVLAELEETHRQLQLYAGQVEELAAIEERNRLARQLHDSVSQTMFSIILNTRAAQLLLERDPGRVRPQIEALQALVQSALADMRSLIAELRDKKV
jgi:signal transduction histidine kinase